MGTAGLFTAAAGVQCASSACFASLRCVTPGEIFHQVANLFTAAAGVQGEIAMYCAVV